MKKRKFGFAMASLLAVGTLLGACGAKDEGERHNNKSRKYFLSCNDN